MQHEMEVYDLQFSKTDNPGGYNFQFITRYTFIYAQAMLKTKNIYITHTIHGVILLAQKKKRKNLGLFYNTMKKKLLLQLHTCKNLLDANKTLPCDRKLKRTPIHYDRKQTLMHTEL